ncbi:MAG: hypothetical protein JW909_03230 [Planctomycetes bacterium]|nr:hypothetical protein [Planctomycetota bacterium]
MSTKGNRITKILLVSGSILTWTFLAGCGPMAAGIPRSPGPLAAVTYPGMLCAAGEDTEAPLAQPEQIYHYTPYLELGYYRWAEYLGSEQLLEETGALFSTGVLCSMPWADLEMQLFFGTLAYDGQTMLGTPVETDTDYFGFIANSTGSWRGRRAIRPEIGSEPIYRLTLALWSRDIQSTPMVMGYDEFWESIIAMTGAGYYWKDSFGNKYASRALVGLTLFTMNAVDAFGVTLYPHIDLALTLEICCHNTNKFFWRAAMEIWTFSESSESSGFFQPESTRAKMSATMGWVF